MKIDIIGAGSLGLLLAGKLAQAGNEIRLWCKGIQQSQDLTRCGITVSYEGQKESIHVAANQFKAITIKDFAEKFLQEPADCLILTVKQNVLHNELQELLVALDDQSPNIVCFQNGSGHMEMLQKLLPHAHLYAAVTTDAAKVVSTTEVIHAGSGETWMGSWNIQPIEKSPKEEPAVVQLLQNLNLAGFSVFMSNEVETMIYKKLLINAVINPLTAIWRIPNGELLKSSTRMESMKELYEEAIAVYRAHDITYDDNAWDLIIKVCRATSGNTSSMLSDVLAARTTEISWINGSIVRMAERFGIDVPAHQWVCRLVEGMIVEEE